MRLALTALLPACAAVTAVPEVGPPDGGWASGRYEVAHDGRQRTFHLDLPPDLPAGAPVVFVLHGYTESAARIRSYAGFTALAEREGLIVVYPDGTRDARGQRFHDVGYAFHDERVDDVGLYRALTDRLVADLGADPAAVFVTGMSNGGDMAYRLACLDEPFVRAIAPVAGTILEAFKTPCEPARRVPILAMHGTADEVTWWGGDPTNEGGWGAYLSVEDTIGHFVTWYGLDTFEERDLPDLDPDDGSTPHLFRATRSDDPAAVVQLITLAGGGHTWPGTPGANADVDPAETIWAFFDGTR